MAKLLQFGQRVVVGTPALLIRIAGKGGGKCQGKAFCRYGMKSFSCLKDVYMEKAAFNAKLLGLRPINLIPFDFLCENVANRNICF